MKTQRILGVALSIALLAAAAGAQAPGQQRGTGQAPPQPAVSPNVWAAPAQPQAQQASAAFQSACGNQPMCYDAPDFAVAVVDFRMSLASGYKLMDATLRFVNKTNQPLILGYLEGSAVALDDQGNRYVPYGDRGLAGIGVVNGGNADPKFVLQPGGAGDARWELLWRPGPQDPIGSAFDLSMTIREVNTLVGGQHSLGGEIPLRFQGLANGATGTGSASGAAPVGTAGAAGASPMLAQGTAGLPPCGQGGNAAGTMTAVAGAANSVGGQQTANATGTATNTAGNAMAQIASLKSIFGKKNATAPATNVAGAANCIPAANSSAMPVAAGTSTVPATAGQAVSGAPAAAVPGAATPAPAANAKTPATAATARTSAAPANARGAVPAGAKPATPAPANTAAKPAVVNTASPNAKPAPQAATAAATKAPATVPAKKPATTTPPPATPPNK